MGPDKNISVDRGQIAEFCRRKHIRKLALLRSVLRPDFSPESDVDVLVEFDPAHIPGLIRLGTMAGELSELLEGRTVDLLTPEDLSALFRDKVLASAQAVYAA